MKGKAGKQDKSSWFCSGTINFNATPGRMQVSVKLFTACQH